MKRKIFKLLSGVKQALFVLVLTVLFSAAYSQTTYTFNYTGSVQSINLSPGIHIIQAWGGVGGDNLAAGTGGKGGYTTGTVNITVAGNYYVYVGGKGITGLGGQPSALGGFNGGGDAGAYTTTGYGMGSGGGASHVASATGLLSSLSGNQSAVIIVAAGGGGAGSNHGGSNLQDIGGNAGGLTGGNGQTGTYGGTGGTQTLGGTGTIQNGVFGQGGNNSGSNTGGGGGGGWYGGGAAQWEGSGGGSGYIGGLTSGLSAGTGQPGFIANPDITGNGYVLITKLCNVNLTSNLNPICKGGSATLATNGGSPSWNTGQTSSNIVVSPSVTTSYTVTANGTGTNVCTSSAVIVLTVNPLPVLTTSGFPSTVCVGGTASLTASGGASPASYTWSSGNPSVATVTVVPFSNTTYTVVGANVFGCTSSQTLGVVVNTNSLTVNPPLTICMGKTANLTASGANTYTWTGGLMFYTIPVSPTVNTTYNVSGTDAFGCVLNNIVTVTVVDPPDVLASSTKTNACRFDVITLSGFGATTYTWSNGFVGSTFSYTLPADVNYYFSVTGTDANGCTKSASVTVVAQKCVGIGEIGAEQYGVRLMPNPGTGLFNVAVNKGSADLQLTVYNELGMLVKSQAILADENKLDIQNEKAGIYFVRISENNQVIKVLKLIKE